MKQEMIEERPWGSFEVLYSSKDFIVKRIDIKPKCKLSLQYHGYRCEHWIGLEGTIKVTKGDCTHYLCPNDYIFIPQGEVHRIENTSSKDIVSLIEIQVGDKLSEDDIIRLEDDFGRITSKM